jgi:hypothetical protein
MRKKPAERFYEPSMREARAMIETVRQTLAKSGMHGVDIHSAFHPTIQINMPRKTRKDGGVNYVSFELCVINHKH